MRVQLAMNVRDLTESISFYSKLFGEDPTKVKDGYANWALEDPPMKFVIFENHDAPAGTINHLGVEVESAEQVVEEEQRLTSAGLLTTGVDDTICCFAEKVETWVVDPNGPRWEYYVKQADHDTQFANVVLGGRLSADADGQSGQPCCG
jgi:catechol 2,3-dioxygenase-like lactoylglutathione lyase family enzyme